ncbi:MAG: two-component system response regulator [Deltaproteobacteria bacterium]
MRRKLLVIDDEKDFCYFLKKNLETTGAFSVAVAHHPDRGLRLARRTMPDVILLDICMPSRDGFEVLRSLKEDLKTVSIPVIMLTALEDDSHRKRASWFYNDGYVVKPVNYKVLLEEIERVLTLKARV